MSNAQFAEAVSADPFIQKLHRRAVRVLNDQTLDREQRVRLIRQLQQSLLSHQADVANKANKTATRKAKGQRLFGANGEPVAVPSQILARRREMRERPPELAAPEARPERLHVVADKGRDASRRRPTLTLARA